jgi:hypothetical protein
MVAAITDCASVGKVAIESFNNVEPRTAGGNEVNMKSFVPFAPCFDLGVFVCGVVIHYQIQFRIIGCFSVDSLEKRNPLLMPMAWHA